MRRWLALLLVCVMLASGCASPPGPLQEEDVEDERPRKTLPTFSPRPESPNEGRIRPATEPAPEQTEDPITTTDSPTPTTNTTTPEETQTPTPSPTPTTDPSQPTESPNPSQSPTPTAEPTASPTPTETATASPSPTHSGSPSPSETPPSPSPTPVPEGNIRTEATDQDASPGFSVDIDGEGTNRIGAVAISRSFGTVELDGTAINTYTYERIPWVEFEYLIYQGLGVRGDSWVVFWFYCQEGALKWVYHESTHGDPLRFESATGTCGDVETSPVRVQLPATDMTPPSFGSDHRIDGAEIQLDDGRGWALTGDRNWTMYAFQTVDCSQDCGSPGWHEIHVVLWDPTDGRAAFAILYLHSDRPEEVSLLYGLRLPPLVRMSATFQAGWSL